MRPLGVTLIGAYQILRGLVSVLFGLAIIAFTGLAAKLASFAAEGRALERFLSGFGHIAGLFVLLTAACHIVAGYGVLQMRKWGRLVTMLLSAVGLVLLLPFLHGFWPMIVAIINGATIIYFVLPAGKQAFRSPEDEKHLRIAA